MIVSDAETRLGSQYTIDTLRVLRARFPGVKFVWVMGADSLATFHRWRGWTQIMREVPVAVISRPWAALKSRTSPAARRFAFARRPASAAATLPDATAPAWVYLTGPLNFASSTAMRSRQNGSTRRPFGRCGLLKLHCTQPLTFSTHPCYEENPRDPIRSIPLRSDPAQIAHEDTVSTESSTEASGPEP
jgi:hypothetical protein